jgi:hypothetical protein
MTALPETRLAPARGNADRPEDTRQYARAQPLGITTKVNSQQSSERSSTFALHPLRF